MNKNRFLIALLAVFALIFVGCSKDNEEEVIKKDDTDGTEEFRCKLLNNREINREGGTFYWAVKASEAWALDPSKLADWMTIEPLEGKAGTTGVTLVVKKLPDDKERTIELPFVLGEKEVKITVRQTQEGGKEEEEGPACRFTENKAFGKDGGSLICTLETSADWTLSEDIEWLTVSPMEGKAGETQLTLTAEASGSILRMALLNFTLDGKIVELFISQNQNDSKPTLTLLQEVEKAGKQVTMYGHCAFENDGITLEEVGFVYQETGDDEWTRIPSESAITNGAFDFMKVVQLNWGKTYIYKPYAKLDGVVYDGEEATFTIENRVIADGVWYYENFDGMYDPATKKYSDVAKGKRYNYWSLSDFETDGGFLCKNQANTKYEVKRKGTGGNSLYLNMNSNEGSGQLSAEIHPDDVTGLGLSEGTQLYAGASGNWKIGTNYQEDWNLMITGLDFEGAGDLRLTFGCCTSTSYSEVLVTGSLKVYTSVDGATWKEKTYTVGATTSITNKKWWKPITVDGLDDKITAIRIQLCEGGKGSSMALDDIKVIAQP